MLDFDTELLKFNNKRATGERNDYLDNLVYWKIANKLPPLPTKKDGKSDKTILKATRRKKFKYIYYNRN